MTKSWHKIIIVLQPLVKASEDLDTLYGEVVVQLTFYFSSK